MNVRDLDEDGLPRIDEYLSQPEPAGLTELPLDRGLTLSADEISNCVYSGEGTSVAWSG